MNARFLSAAVSVLAPLALLYGELPEARQARRKPAPNPIVEMVVAKRGTVRIEVFQKDAPKTAGQFVRLAKKGFYDGHRFHRVRSEMAQAGDPQSKLFSAAQIAPLKDADYGRVGLGGGGSGKRIRFEENSRTHETGSVAMALEAPRSDTADSQFFINLRPNHQWDGDYCVFGRVVKGMDVVQKIKQGDLISEVKVLKR